MLEKDNVGFFDTSVLSETPGIRGRCNTDYLTSALKTRFPDESFTVTRAEINDWIKTYKKGREEFKAAADENFKKVESFFASK